MILRGNYFRQTFVFRSFLCSLSLSEPEIPVIQEFIQRTYLLVPWYSVWNIWFCLLESSFFFFSCFSSSVPTCFVNQTIADKQQQKHISEGWKRLRKIFNSLPNFFFSRWLINLIEIVSTSFIFGSSHLVNRPLVNKTKCWSSLVFDNSLVLRIFLFS